MEGNKTLAVVGTTTIRQSDIEEAILAMGPRGAGYNNPQGHAAILDQLINQKLFIMDARKNMYEYEQAFKDQLARIKEDLLFQYALAKLLERVKVSDDEIKSYFEANPDQFQGEEMVSASHILVADEAQASDLLKSIETGEISFEDAARQHSTCPSRAEGGNLGAFGRGQMVPEFEAAAFDMQPNELRGPIKTQFGYHIIRLDARHAATPLKLADAKDAIYEKLLADKQKQAYQSKINQLKIMYPVNR